MKLTIKISLLITGLFVTALSVDLSATALTTERIATGFTKPVHLTFAPGDSTRHTRRVLPEGRPWRTRVALAPPWLMAACPPGRALSSNVVVFICNGAIIGEPSTMGQTTWFFY